MARPNGQLPALQRARNKNTGHYIGSFFIWHRPPGADKYARINLATKNIVKAEQRRHEAVTMGKRQFVYDDDNSERTAQLLNQTSAPAPSVPVVPMTVARQLGPIAPETPTPIVVPPEPAPLDQRETPPDPSTFDTAADDWTKDAARAAGAPDMPQAASSESENKDAPAPAAQQPVDDGSVRIKDLAQLGPIFVTASRIAVQLQIAFHVLIARYLFKVELDPIRDDVPKDIAGFMAAQGRPWAETDPREGGRQMWERFARRICPDNLVVPDWVLAPALVAVGTLPTQIANAKPINKAKPHVPVIPAQPAAQPTTPAKPPEPPPPTSDDAARTRHIPVMSVDMSPDAMS